MEKLFEENPYLTQFTATVESCAPGKKGFDVVLDQTAFYPEGGGRQIVK
jgi:alanyl-tRNA synthetase